MYVQKYRYFVETRLHKNEKAFDPIVIHFLTNFIASLLVLITTQFRV